MDTQLSLWVQGILLMLLVCVCTSIELIPENDDDTSKVPYAIGGSSVWIAPSTFEATLRLFPFASTEEVVASSVSDVESQCNDRPECMAYYPLQRRTYSLVLGPGRQTWDSSGTVYMRESSMTFVYDVSSAMVEEGEAVYALLFLVSSDTEVLSLVDDKGGTVPVLNMSSAEHAFVQSTVFGHYAAMPMNDAVMKAYNVSALAEEITLTLHASKTYPLTSTAHLVPYTLLLEDYVLEEKETNNRIIVGILASVIVLLMGLVFVYWEDCFHYFYQYKFD